MAPSAHRQDLLRTHTDRYGRFSLAAELVRSVADRRGLKLLDVGSLDADFGRFVPEHQVRPYDKLVRPGQGLPFRDGFFDIVLALDVLEHVERDEREFFVAELIRAGRLGCVLSFPVAGAQEMENFVLDLTGNSWLLEHRQRGLPDPAEVEGLFDRLGLKWTMRPCAAQASWMALSLLFHQQPDDFKTAVSTFCNTHFAAEENRDPAYRHIYLLQRRG